MRAGVRVLVLRAAGINCDEETAFAWEQAGGRTERIHVNRLIERPGVLGEFDILTIPGGFSYGDDIAAGRILGNQLGQHLGAEIRRFVEDGRLALGICNGFQTLVKAGMLPGEMDAEKAELRPPAAGHTHPAGPGEAPRKQDVTVTVNAQGRYEDRWVHLQAEVGHSPWLEKGEILHLPVAHAEGRIVADSPATLERLSSANRVALRYVDAAGRRGGFPVNPNGSQDDIAGLVDATGRVLGLMPHPERNVHPRHAPGGKAAGEPEGRRLFARAVRYARQR